MTAPRNRPWLSADTKVGIVALISQLAVMIWTLSKYDSRITAGENEREQMRKAIAAMTESQNLTNIRLSRIETKIEQADKDRDSTQAGIREILNRLK